MKKNKKKVGGTIKDWQIHNLSVSNITLEVAYPGENAKPMIISGTVVDDPLGRWVPGDHMRTSLVCKLDRENGTVETLNTIYKLSGEEGKDVLPDLGNKILNIFY
jgi:hypothetical protein